MNFIILGMSLLVIMISADKLIDSSAKIAKYYKVPAFIIGVSIIAFGTSAPELIVGIISAINGDNALSYGNIIGSGINNMGINLGITAIIISIMVSDQIIKKEMLILTGTEILLLILSFNGYLSRIDGIILLVLGGLFIAYLLKGASNNEEGNDVDALSKKSIVKKWMVLIISLIALVFSGHMIVESSQAIAIELGIEQSAIGMTLIALGTAMPEFITSITAARRKGSNIFNILIILGVSATISPISINFINTANILSSLWVEATFLLLLNIFVYFIMYKTRKISRITGIFLVLLYVIYMTKQIYFMV